MLFPINFVELGTNYSGIPTATNRLSSLLHLPNYDKALNQQCQHMQQVRTLIVLSLRAAYLGRGGRGIRSDTIRCGTALLPIDQHYHNAQSCHIMLYLPNRPLIINRVSSTS